MLIVTVGLGAVIFVLHLELTSAQSALTHCEAQSTVMSSTLAAQNASIKHYQAAQASLSKALAAAERANHKTEIKTRTLLVTVVKTKILPGCTHAMNFLRAEAHKIGG